MEGLVSFVQHICAYVTEKLGLSDEDRFRALPEHVLSLIVSKLPSSAEHVRTSIVSKAWKESWKHTNRIVFDAGNYASIGHNNIRIIHSINEFLKVHDCSCLDEIFIRYAYDPKYRTDFQNWIRSFFSTQIIGRICLDFRYFDGMMWGKECCVFPVLDILEYKGLANVKVVTFKGVDITGENLNLLLDHTPFLVELKVVAAPSLTSFKRVRKSRSLKVLELKTYLTSFEMSQAELTSLSLDRFIFKFKDPSITTTFEIEGAESLENFHLGGEFASSYMELRFNRQFEMLSRTLKSLTLNIPTSVSWENMTKIPQLDVLETLIIQTWSDGNQTSNCVFLINRAPSLKLFKFQAGWSMYMSTSKSMYLSNSKLSKKSFSSPMTSHLKLREVYIEGYYGIERDVSIATYFLDNFDERLTLFINTRNQDLVMDQPHLNERYGHKDDDPIWARETAVNQLSYRQSSKVKIVFV